MLACWVVHTTDDNGGARALEHNLVVTVCTHLGKGGRPSPLVLMSLPAIGFVTVATVSSAATSLKLEVRDERDPPDGDVKGGELAMVTACDFFHTSVELVSV